MLLCGQIGPTSGGENQLRFWHSNYARNMILDLSYEASYGGAMDCGVDYLVQWTQKALGLSTPPTSNGTMPLFACAFSADLADLYPRPPGRDHPPPSIVPPVAAGVGYSPAG